MKQESTEIVEQTVATAVEQTQEQTANKDDDFLAGVQAADAESFNVCISCD